MDIQSKRLLICCRQKNPCITPCEIALLPGIAFSKNSSMYWSRSFRLISWGNPRESMIIRNIRVVSAPTQSSFKKILCLLFWGISTAHTGPFSNEMEWRGFLLLAELPTNEIHVFVTKLSDSNTASTKLEAVSEKSEACERYSPRGIHSQTGKIRRLGVKYPGKLSILGFLPHFGIGLPGTCWLTVQSATREILLEQTFVQNWR